MQVSDCNFDPDPPEMLLFTAKVGIGPIVGGGSSFMSGRSFARVWYMLKAKVQFTSTTVMHKLISLMDEKNWDKGLGSYKIANSKVH